MTTTKPGLPALPLDEWEDTKMTVHLFLQIMGKVRMALMPWRNHWWNITLYVSPKGLTTHPMPVEDGTDAVELTLNLIDHRLEVGTTGGAPAVLQLADGLTVGDFHRQLFAMLRESAVAPHILDKPYDLPVKGRFGDITEYASYQSDYVERFHRMLLWVNSVFEEFSGRFNGKTCPVHLYWHHMDLAVTRFSGKRGPPLEKVRTVADREAYSHEAVSCGFWVGDENVRAPAFYSYTYPSPEGLDQEPLTPTAAQWMDAGGSAMATLMYDDVRKEPDPRSALLGFMESAYQAGAKLAGWDIDGFAASPPS